MNQTQQLNKQQSTLPEKENKRKIRACIQIAYINDTHIRDCVPTWFIPLVYGCQPVTVYPIQELK